MSDVGEGWRRLEVGERIEEGDQNRWSNGEWREAHSGFIGWQISSPYDPWRRRVHAATADAPTPTPFAEPLAWGVQFTETGFLLGHYTERYEAEAVCRATNNGESECPYGPVTVVPLYAALDATPHPWCRDVDRDLAARGDEDARAVTLPEWRELPGIVADQVRTIANVLDVLGSTCARVAALESAPKLAPAANADAEAKLADAIRERDEARAECERLRYKVRAMEGQSQMSIKAEIAVEEAWEACAISPHWPDDEPGTTHRYAESMRREIERLRARVAELEAAPRGGLTDEEHRAVAFAAKAMRGHTITGNLKEIADQLDALLDRPTTPTSEAGTVPVSVRLGGVGHWFVGGETRIISKNGWVTLDLTPAQVRELERQVRGEVGG